MEPATEVMLEQVDIEAPTVPVPVPDATGTASTHPRVRREYVSMDSLMQPVAAKKHILTEDSFPKRLWTRVKVGCASLPVCAGPITRC